MSGAVYARTPNLGLGLLEFNFPNWGDDENQNMKVIDAGFGLTGISVKGAWQNATLYNAGDLVVDTDQNTIWRCQVNHTSASSGTFAADRAAHPTYWVDASQSLHARGQWAPATTYYTNDVVYENANKYSWALATRQFVSGGSYTADVASGALVVITDTTQAVADANAAKTAAQASQTAAAGSASAASTSASNASTSASTAQGYAVQAQGYRDAALTYSNNAATSAGLASTYATNASNSASAASTSATNAANSAASALAIYNSMYPDAASDGFCYGRRNGAWAQVVNRAGDTMTGKLITVASASGGAGLTLPHGAAPSAPVNGDLWTTTAGLYGRFNGATVGPFAAGVAEAPTDGNVYGRKGSTPDWIQVYDTVASDLRNVRKAGDTMTGRLVMSTSVAGGASMNIPAGVAPTTPNDGDMWSTTAGLFARISGTTIQFATTASLGNYLPLTGGSLTGQIAIQPASGTSAAITIKGTGAANSVLALDKGASGQSSLINGLMNSLARWQIYLGDNAAETGSNVGSNFQIYRFNDAGTVIDSVFTVNRANGQATFSQQLNINGAITALSNGTFNGTVISSNAVTGNATDFYIANNGTVGTIKLRPQGMGSFNGETTFDTAGKMTNGGGIQCGGGIINNAGGSITTNSAAAGGGTGAGVVLTVSGQSYSKMAGTASQTHWGFWNNVAATPAQVGHIDSSASTTTYATSSDERLKDFGAEMTLDEAMTIIEADPVRHFTWKVDGEAAVGWSAQHSWSVSHDLASPPPADANLEAQPGDPDFLPWGVDQGKRSPYVWAACMGMMAKIRELEARIATLEARP